MGKKKAGAAKISGDEVTVVWNNGSRVYSRAVHGDEFADLANEFCETHATEGAKIIGAEEEATEEGAEGAE